MRASCGRWRRCWPPSDSSSGPKANSASLAAPETGVTFVENALQKARHASRSAKLPAIADDSGLVVPALGGAPGVRSARYAGDDATDADNNRKLIGSLAGLEDRTAWFYCALVFIEGPDDPAPLLATGTWRGRIIDQPRGAGGFGYDPHFLVPQPRPHLGGAGPRGEERPKPSRPGDRRPA